MNPSQVQFHDSYSGAHDDVHMVYGVAPWSAGSPQTFQGESHSQPVSNTLGPVGPICFNTSVHGFSQSTLEAIEDSSNWMIDSSSSLHRATISMQSPRRSALQQDTTDVTISISTAFHPNLEPSPDTVIVASDGVLFYVNSRIIVDKCPAAFQPILSGSLSDRKRRGINNQVDVPSAELNVILHALYQTSPAVHSPDFQTIVRAIDYMPIHSIPPEVVIHPSSLLHDLVLSYAPLHPLETYALAAHHKLHAMAVTVSSHLLSLDLANISDAMAERIGAIYLKKLLLLHVGRNTSLKTILLHPPHPHPPTKNCGFENQKKLTRAWALVSAYLAWDARPELSTHSMHAVLDPLMQHLQCPTCHQSLEDRIKEVVVQWISVKVSE